jgi:hypothetical protein
MGDTKDQPAPVKNNSKPVWELVIEDMLERNKIGIVRYGTALQPFNGRNALIDAYQEALDLVVYLRQELEEREELNAYAGFFIDEDTVEP